MYSINLTYLLNLYNYSNSVSEKHALLYADFNVINYLYYSGYKTTNPNIIFYPDSTAVFTAISLINRNKYKKLVSTDLLDDFLQTLIKDKRKIFFFGNSNEVLTKMIEKLQDKYPNINICGYNNGYEFKTDNVINQINYSNAEILFVGLGAGKQEKWVIDNYERINCKLILTCGGWFNLLSGHIKRAPKIFRKLHLEWLFKLITDFFRIWKRYFLGIPVFFYRTLIREIVIELIDRREK
ncbi:MAG: WecB/TagA/CpsF family glycosyltransferase [Bacteroidota bacterium]